MQAEKITEQTSKADREADNKVNSKTDNKTYNKTDNKADKKTDNKTDGIRAGKQAADILMRGIGGLKFFLEFPLEFFPLKCFSAGRIIMQSTSKNVR